MEGQAITQSDAREKAQTSEHEVLSVLVELNDFKLLNKFTKENLPRPVLQVNLVAEFGDKVMKGLGHLVSDTSVNFKLGDFEGCGQLSWFKPTNKVDTDGMIHPIIPMQLTFLYESFMLEGIGNCIGVTESSLVLHAKKLQLEAL